MTNVNRFAAVITLIPRQEFSKAVEQTGQRPLTEMAPQRGTPYALKREYLVTIDERGPQVNTAPPWGTLAAVDMHTGETRWEVPLGSMYPPDVFPEAEQWGSLNFGGCLTTASGLVFIAASMDGHFRAFDTETGELLWKSPLPAGGQATPMTYQKTEDGKQYVVIVAGGHGKMGTKLGDYVVAFALP